MTDQELEAISAREQRSTLGPWQVKRVQHLYPSEAGDGRTYPAVRGFRSRWVSTLSASAISRLARFAPRQ